jgi:hypothetical protein
MEDSRGNKVKAVPDGDGLHWTLRPGLIARAPDQSAG